MANDIISQNVKLIDKKMIFDKLTIEKIKGVPYTVYHVTREFEPVICPECKKVVTKTKEYKLRKVKTFVNHDYPVMLFYKQRRLVCSCGKTMSENNTIVNKSCNISNYLKLEILKQCKRKISFKDIADELNVDPMTVINTFMENVDIQRKPLGEVLCIDEFSANINEDNKYACIIGNPVKGEIVDILPSRHQDYLERYLSKIPRFEREQVKLINMDMWRPYKTSCSAYFPNAKIAVDPFHYISKMTEAFNKIRVEVEEECGIPVVRNLLRNNWKLFILHENKLSEKEFYSYALKMNISQRGLVEYCLNSDPKLEEAWTILQKIYKMRNECNADTIKDKLSEVIKDLKKSRLRQLISVARTYNDWFNEICNSFETFGKKNQKASNAFAEGKNRLCKEIKAIGCGFQNFAIFSTRILYISDNNPSFFRSDGKKRNLYKKPRKHKKAQP